jgi:hypothetical protein
VLNKNPKKDRCANPGIPKSHFMPKLKKKQKWRRRRKLRIYLGQV